ncbi:hypothetical protein Q5H92_15685 [Hymenobacter sp. M29]|uniref:SRPBCC family protein n=1 Tax=Hymenobacter mellowenesis TaxID=3063995 RepID=A0ABT9AGI7_9BACT|nr:hypothetical protein [Hymenobacter sp. M29]MDO7847807.1 hypothetical protein [Hymenobacter sp. M29]
MAIGIGLLYSLTARFVLGEEFINDSGLLTGSFLCITPVAIGAITAHYSPPTEGKWRRLVVAPFSAVMLFLFFALLFHLEGFICIVIIGPLYLLLACIGASFYAGLADPQEKKNDKTLVVTAFALLPFLAAPLENQLSNPDSFRRIENTVIINAPPAVVWQHIIRVAPIQAHDLGHSLIDDIGFPRPVEATLTHEGVGGVRHATFERGVEFIETVDDWQPLRRLSFSIVPNTATIPPTTFDEHVIVGGRFFDVLRGTYELQPAGPGRTRLVLHSEQRLSTHLNWYAGLWTGYVMSEIQGRILAVLQRRCEAAGATAAAVAARPHYSRFGFIAHN